MTVHRLDPSSRNVVNTPEQLAAECFRAAHPDERVLYTRLVSHEPQPVVVVAYGAARPPHRAHFAVDLEQLEARALSDEEVAELGDDGA